MPYSATLLFSSFDTLTSLIILAISLALATPLVLGFLVLKFSHLFLSAQKKRADNKAPQASHRGNPLRIGGLLILIGCFLSAGAIASLSEGKFILLILASAIPVFVAGFVEDMGIFVSPIIRLLAAFLSSGFAIYLTGFLIPDVDLIYIDTMFTAAPIAILFTVFCTGLFCHSLNIVDGLNGLATQVIICAAIGLTIIGFQIDFKQLAAFCMILTFATVGFGYFNWPNARIFLGDAGSYGIGHVLIWIGIAYLSTDNKIAFPALLLIIYWPIADIVHTVARRILARRNIFQPDSDHIHQKTKRLMQNLLSKRFARRYSNPFASLILLPMIAFPPFVGVMLIRQAFYAWLAVLLFFLGFMIVYQIVSRYERLLTKTELR